MKYFCEEAAEYHVVAAGSLLGVSIHEGVSYPVGKVDILDLYPLNFREFLYAVEERGLLEALESKDYKLMDAFHEKYLFWLKNYYYTGGMPAVVESFRKNKDYKEVRQMQNDIVRQYEREFGKHIDAKTLPRIRMVWDAIPMQLAKENKKFFFGQIKKGARSTDYTPYYFATERSNFEQDFLIQKGKNIRKTFHPRRCRAFFFVALYI